MSTRRDMLKGLFTLPFVRKITVHKLDEVTLDEVTLDEVTPDEVYPDLTPTVYENHSCSGSMVCFDGDWQRAEATVPVIEGQFLVSAKDGKLRPKLEGDSSQPLFVAIGNSEFDNNAVTVKELLASDAKKDLEP